MQDAVEVIDLDDCSDSPGCSEAAGSAAPHLAKMTAKKQVPAKAPAVLEPQPPSVKAPPHVGPDFANTSEVESLKRQLQVLQEKIRLHQSDSASPVLQKPLFSPEGSLPSPTAVCAATPAAVPKCPSPAVAATPKAAPPTSPATTVATTDTVSSASPASARELANPALDPVMLEQTVDLSPEETCPFSVYYFIIFLCCASGSV